MTRLNKCVLVGHCGADAYAIDAVVARACDGLPVVHVSDEAGLQREAPGDTLLLVNRVLDGVFEDADGPALIRRVAQRADAAPTMMLVSNFDDAQQEAVAAGAVPGFGKRALYEDATTAYLRQVVAGEASG